MKKIDFKEFLDNKSWDYDKKTIEEMMEKELEKEPENINMEFVDACILYLTESTKTKTSDAKVKEATKRKRIKLSRLLIAAVIMIMIISIGMTAYAKANNIKISNMFVKMFSSYASIDYSEKNNEKIDTADSHNSAKLYEELKNGGIENIVLPKELYSAKYDNIEWTNDFTSYFAGFIAEIDNKKLSIAIETFTDEKWITNPDIQGEFTASKIVNVNGIDVYLFERNGNEPKKANTTISYQIGLTQYDINCNYNIEQAEQFITNMN